MSGRTNQSVGKAAAQERQLSEGELLTGLLKGLQELGAQLQ